MASKGFPVVMEGQRINLRVYRRYFYPIKMNHNGTDFIVYSDTRRETEINYKNADAYGLDDPFKRINLIRLARATKSLKTNPENLQEYIITICTNKELYEPHAETLKYIPFDPKRLDSLEDRIKKERRKIDWDKRMNINR